MCTVRKYLYPPLEGIYPFNHPTLSLDTPKIGLQNRVPPPLQNFQALTRLLKLINYSLAKMPN